MYDGSVKLISWNVNGLRAAMRKNSLAPIFAEVPDVICLQETRCGPDDIEPLGGGAYAAFWNEARKKGYSGTAIFARGTSLRSVLGIGVSAHDREGRVLTVEFPEYFVAGSPVLFA